MGVCALYMLALGNLRVGALSARAERRARLAGRRPRVPGLSVSDLPVALLPVGLAYLARYAFDSEVMFALVLALAAIIGGGVLLDRAGVGGERRGAPARADRAGAVAERRAGDRRVVSRGAAPAATPTAYCFDFSTSTSSCTDAALFCSIACSWSVSLIW